MDSLEISSKLISFKSITPNSAGSLEYIQKILKKNKFECHLLEFNKSKVKNLYAILRGGAGPNVFFAGHTDVVPPGNEKEWKTNPFDPIVKNGFLYGRGASDMKTGIASFISASLKFLELKKYNFNGSLGFLLTSDEEGDAKFGTKSMIDWLRKNKKKIDFCLVGEPTNPSKLGEMIKIGRRGSINGTITVIGKQGHVAYPEKSENPIDYVIKICKELTKPLDSGSKSFQPSRITITSIDVDNNVPNITPSYATISFNVRFNDLHTSSDIKKILNNRIKGTKAKYKLETKTSGESFLNFSEILTNAIIKSIKKITKKKPKLSTSGGTSDARFISKVCPVIEFGLVGKTMHQINENVSTNDIRKLSDIYFEFLQIMFSEKSD
jgi:succinyl-diaminopimelate desuccinylase